MTSNFKNHFSLMANYNQRMNNQVYGAADELTTQQLNQDCGAFFGSVLATLNHVLVGDLLWLTRYQNHPARFRSLASTEDYPVFVSLKQIAYCEFSELNQARRKLDITIIEWIENEITEPDFTKSIQYSDTQGNQYSRNFAELLAHFFNHQTHHRGQVSTLLSQFGYDIGITDFLIDIPCD